MLFDFTLTGKTPLLLHADDIEQADFLKSWREDPANKNNSEPGNDRTPAWTWMSYLYSDGHHVAMPSESIMAALRGAGAKVILKKQTTYKALTQSGLFILTEFCSLEGIAGPVPMARLEPIRCLTFAEQAEAVKPLGLKLFVKRAAVSSSKHIRVRPRFDSWKVRGRIEITDPDIKPAKLADIFRIAGDRMGLGDWRPSAKKGPGPFGRFDVELTPAS